MMNSLDTILCLSHSAIYLPLQFSAKRFHFLLKSLLPIATMDSYYQFDAVLKILQHFRSIIDAYMVDFFVENLWQTIPNCWRMFLERTSFNELSNFINFTEPLRPLREPIPLSLLSLRACCQQFCISRDGVNIRPREILRQLAINNVEIDNSKQWSSYESEFLNASGQNRLLSVDLQYL